jgi:hypothetical protein
MKFWTIAFWKDAGERVGATALESLLGTMLATGFDLDRLLSWEGVWKGVASTTLVALIKTLLAGLANPNTGASLGTTHPVDIVEALVTQKTIYDPAMQGQSMFENDVAAVPGDVIAGKASSQPDDTPVVVSLPPSVS